MTSHAVSRGRLAPLVGKTFGLQAPRVFRLHSCLVYIHFAHTHKIMIMFCISVEYLWHCVDGSF